MARTPSSAELYVFMNGRKVGRLSRGASGRLEYAYAAAWLDWEQSRPLSLSLPLTPESYAGDLVENYFDNLLPDNQLIRNRIQARFAARSNRAFDLLWHAGRDCVGAVQLIPEDAETLDVQKVEADGVIDQVAGQLPQAFPEEMSTSLFAGMREARDRLVRSRPD